MPEIDNSIFQKYSGQGVIVYGIHPNDAADQVQDFIEQTGVTFPIVADRGTRREFAFPAGVGYPYPRDIVVGKDLTVHSIKNSFDVDEMDALIEALLAE